MNGYPREITRPHVVAAVVPGMRLVRFACPVKRCKATAWKLMVDRTHTLNYYGAYVSWDRVFCLDPGHGRRNRLPVMVEAEALELGADGQWLPAEPRAATED